MVHTLVQVAAVIGPILGGVINSNTGMQRTCFVMSIAGAVSMAFYLVFAIFVWCTVHNENDLLPQASTLDNTDFHLAEKNLNLLD